jgi:hypothetical protein
MKGMIKPLLSKKELNLTGSFEERVALLNASRNRFSTSISQMPPALKLLKNTYEYQVIFSEQLVNEKNRIVSNMKK